MTRVSPHTEERRAGRLLDRVEEGMALLGGLLILALVLLATVNILGRWLFDRPVDGYIDWVEQGMAFFAFLGIAYTQRLGGHIRMDLVVSRLRGRALWALEAFTTALTLLLTLVLVHGSWLHFLRAWRIGDSSLDIDLPTWPAKLVVPVALGFLALRLVLQLARLLHALWRGEPPAGVPLPEDPATVAAREAERLLEEEEASRR